MIKNITCNATGFLYDLLKLLRNFYHILTFDFFSIILSLAINLSDLLANEIFMYSVMDLSYSVWWIYTYYITKIKHYKSILFQSIFFSIIIVMVFYQHSLFSSYTFSHISHNTNSFVLGTETSRIKKLLIETKLSDEHSSNASEDVMRGKFTSTSHSRIFWAINNNKIKFGRMKLR